MLITEFRKLCLNEMRNKMGNISKINKVARYIKDYGLRYAAKKVYYRYKIKYKVGKKYCPFEISDEERMKEEAYRTKGTIKISIVVPLYNTPVDFLNEMIDSVKKQTYTDWELCLADASDDRNLKVQKKIEEYLLQDNKIKYKRLEENKGISENTNMALEMTTGQYVGLMDHDDLLHPSALYHIVKSIEEEKADFIYTDELSFVGKTDRVQSIHFKPDFSWEIFRNNNFICHFTVFKKELLETTGGFRKEFDGSQDYDLFLRILEVTDKVYHIPKVLYFWRLHAGSVAAGVGAKPYTIEAGKKALCDHLKRKNISGTVSASSEYGPFYTIKYDISDEIKILVVVQGKQSEVLAIQEIKKTDLKCDLVDIDEFYKKNISEYAYIFYVADGYEVYRKEILEVNDDKGVFEELAQCLQPKENSAVSPIIYNKDKVYNAGYCYNGDLKECIRPLYKEVPIKDPAYMNRLRFRHNVSLLGGGIFAVKSDIYMEYLKKNGEYDINDISQERLFSNMEWFKICLFIKEKQKNCVLSPLKPLEITSEKIKEEKETTNYSKFVCENKEMLLKKDSCYNENMNLFGKYYFLWK